MPIGRFIVLLAWCLAARGACAQPAVVEPPHTPGLVQAIDAASSHLESLRRAHHIPAIQAAVLIDGRIIYSRAFGLADLESETAAPPTTVFRIASISKAITGVALAKMAARGDIDLDAPIGDSISGLPEDWRRIRCRQLASHTSGIRHYRGLEIWNQQHYASLSDALAIFRDDPLLFEPGARREYSTYGFTLLGVAMEAATGERFDRIIQREVLDPLGMASTIVEGAPDAPRPATPYLLVAGDHAAPSPPTDHSYKIPGGGYLSTAEDLVRLGWGVIGAETLGDDALRLLHTPVTTADGKTHAYSLGWNVQGAPGNDLRLSHGGSQPGSQCFLFADAERRIVVALLCNSRGAPISAAECQRIAAMFMPSSR
ncbi:MAG: beta-lactamase family protein [Phycisphaeraceae bacterium]|nr:beta-lactamase family protein [Phycisphaeraceae bacterium]